MKTDYQNPDVLVIGGGIAGVGAALGAAKTGASVLLVSSEGVIGGDALSGMPLLGACNARGEWVVAGVLRELLDACKEMNGYIGPVCDWRAVNGVCVDPNILHLAIAQAMETHKIQLLLNSTVIEVKNTAGCVESVSVVGKDGTAMDLNPKFVIDVTGDANIASMAGFACESGGKDGEYQPVSLVFRVCNVDFESLLNFVRCNPDEIILAENPTIELDRTQCAQKVFEQGYPYVAISANGALLGGAIQENNMFPCTAVFVTPTSVQRGEVGINVTRKAGINPCNQKEVSDSYGALCKQVQLAFNFLRSSVPGFKQSEISGIAHRVGIRETRRVVGDYVLQTEDVKTGKKSDDGIAKGAHHIDVHGKGTDQIRIPVDDGRSYDIPFGCIVPKGSRNLLVAGRCISSTREANGSARVMGTCIATGEAAGTAGALCVTGRFSDVHDLKVKDLRQVLTGHGAILEGTR
ncbi:MAG: FAD-dependent oxidoreductase [Phycisphaerae bacterium]|nr:FAD-dependent oxidoreductase [Phycisphaerae bacterium]